MEKSRQDIEKEIRQLSYEISQDILRQQRDEGIIPGKLNLGKIQKMLDKWSELEKYYLKSIYNHCKGKQDFEISLFIVFNYIEWQETLTSKMSVAYRNDDDMLGKKFEELRSELEATMGEIRKAVWRNDEIEHQDVL